MREPETPTPDDELCERNPAMARRRVGRPRRDEHLDAIGDAPESLAQIPGYIDGLSPAIALKAWPAIVLHAIGIECPAAPVGQLARIFNAVRERQK